MKQYLLLCDEAGIEALKAVFRTETIQFLEVQGMGLYQSNKFNILVTPVVAPINQAVIELPEQPPVQETPPAV